MNPRAYVLVGRCFRRIFRMCFRVHPRVHLHIYLRIYPCRRFRRYLCKYLRRTFGTRLADVTYTEFSSQRWCSKTRQFR